MICVKNDRTQTLPLIGVGLRYGHYEEALDTPANIDFVEVHAENFFAAGGASKALLNDIKQHYQISLHATSLGLGSVLAPPQEQVDQMVNLVNQTEPILISDHACFTWADVENSAVHAGDLLPIPFNDESLAVMATNVLRIQNILKRSILVENLSAYINMPGSTYSESEFLVKLCQLTGCTLLIDINNLVVNAKNYALIHSPSIKVNVIDYATLWLSAIPKECIGEFHLAGCTAVASDEIMIDDHSQPVSKDVWTLYRVALEKFGAVPTLIEWDENLPSWSELIAEADKARAIAVAVAQDAIAKIKTHKNNVKAVNDDA
jgi:uncharacterized protein (UPF0276 family)